MSIASLEAKLQETLQANQFHVQQAASLREQAVQHEDAAKQLVGRHQTLTELIAEQQAELDAAEAARAEAERLAAEETARLEASRLAEEAEEANRLEAERLSAEQAQPLDEPVAVASADEEESAEA